MTTQPDSARCPRCNRLSHTPHTGKDQWFCHHCKLAFEAGDDGDITYGRPEKRLEREERRLQRTRQSHQAERASRALRGGLGR